MITIVPFDEARPSAFGDFDLIYPYFQKPATWPGTHHMHLCVDVITVVPMRE
jgi:hypothetical protein